MAFVGLSPPASPRSDPSPCVRFVAAGSVFGAFTAVAAQVVGTGGPRSDWGSVRSASSYLVRAVGDMGDGTLSWLSPIGWAHRVRPFAGEHWWVLGLSLAVVVVCSVASIELSDRRDLGSGMLPQRLGPPDAGRGSAPCSGWPPGCSGVDHRLERRAVRPGGRLRRGRQRHRPGARREPRHGAVHRARRRVGDRRLPGLHDAVRRDAGRRVRRSSVLRMRGEESAGRAEILLARPLSRASWACGTWWSPPAARWW